MKYFILISALLISACGGGGGGAAPEFDDGLDEFNQQLPCGDFDITSVPNTPDVLQCVHKSQGKSEIVIYCTNESECVNACERAAKRCL